MAQLYSLPAYDGAVRETTLGGLWATSRAVFVFISLLLFLVPAPAARAETTDGLTVTLEKASLSEPTEKGELTLSGRVTNRSGAPVHEVGVVIWRSTVILRSASVVADALEAERSPLGKPMAEIPSGVAKLTEDGVKLSPGESVPFTVQARLSELELTTGNATYWVGVNASASRIPDEKPSERGRARTLITLPGETPMSVSSVIEISSPPRQVAPNLFRDDDLVSDIAARLDVFADVAAQPGYTYVLDPSLVAELEDMSDGYLVVSGDGTVPGKGTATAAALLAKLRALPDDGFAGQFARADSRVGDAAERGASAAGRVGLKQPVLPERVVNDALLPSSVKPVGALADQPVNGAAVLLAKARLSPQVRLIRTTDDLVADRLATPSWLERTPPPTGGAGGRPGKPRGDEQLASKLDALADSMTTYGMAAPDSGALEMVDAQYARGASHWWDTDTANRSAFLDAVDRRLGKEAFGDGITLDATPRFSMSSSESHFPVTLTNHLADQTVVRVVVSTDAPQRISFDQPEPVTLRPGSSQTVTLLARASSNGLVVARIHAETLDGHMLTQKSSVIVETTNLGRIGWVIVIVSGTVLVVTTVRRFRQVRAQQREIRA